MQRVTLIFSGLFLGIVSIIQAQVSGSWESYIIQKEKGPMSITVDMDYNYTKPNYKNLLIVGTHSSKCLKNGYPDQEGLEKQYLFSDAVAAVVDEKTKNKLVGILTYQCVGFDIFYVKDTTGLRENLTKLLKNKFKNSKNYLQLEPDNRWKYYKASLFPKKLTEEFFLNQESLVKMVIEGDDLSEPRKVSHWVYFRTEKRRKAFITRIGTLNFKVESTKIKKSRNQPYEVEFSRLDKVDPNSIDVLTALLIKLCDSSYGIYDGWGSELVIKE